MGLLDALPIELRRSIVLAIAQTSVSDLSVVAHGESPFMAWRRTVRTMHRLEATSKAWKELVGESAVWLAICELCWPQQTRTLAAAGAVESYRQFCKKKLTVFQLDQLRYNAFGMKDLWWTVEVECSDPADDRGVMTHLTAQTARFEALPDDGWLTLVLDEPVTIMRVADIKLDEYLLRHGHRCVGNCHLLLNWSAFRKTDQKMVELLSYEPQENCGIDFPEDTSSDAECFCHSLTSPAQDHNVDTHQLGEGVSQIHADHGFTYRFAGPPEARVLQLVSLSLSYVIGWDRQDPRGRFCGRSNVNKGVHDLAEWEFMRFLDYQGWQ